MLNSEAVSTEKKKKKKKNTKTHPGGTSNVTAPVTGEWGRAKTPV